MNYPKLNQIAFFFFLGFVFSFAQDISLLESKLLDLEKSYSVEKSKLDILKNNLEILLNELNTLKNQEARDDDKISTLMANAHRVTTEMDKQEEIANNLGKQIKQQRHVLYKAYTVSIDSLTHSLKNQQDNQKRKIETELRQLTHKRSQVSPALPLFSFDPLLIARINSSESKDDLEKSIYMDYLSNALSEVDSNLLVIKEKAEEVSTMIRLDEQAEDFIDDLDGTQFLGSLEIEQTVASNEGKNELFTGSSGFDRGSDLTESLIKIYEQLEPVMNELIETPQISKNDSLASDEYLLLLQGTEKTLKLYKKIIEEKMVGN
jgi:hypothetical protein